MRAAAPPPALALLLAISIALPIAATARAQAAAPRPAASGLAVVASRLLLLPAPGCDVRYSPGALDRAATAQEWLCELAAGAARAVRRATSLEVLLLTRDEWTEAGLPCAYGVPCRVIPGMLALPAAGDPGTVELWRDVLGALPALAGTPLVGSVEEVASLAPADAMASALAARELAAAVGFVVDEPWMNDVLAHLLFLDAARRGGTGRGEAMAGFWGAVSHLPAPGTVQAAAGRSPEAALREELQRQAALFAVAEAIAGRTQRIPARQLWRLQEKAGGTLRAADLRAEWPDAFATLEPAPGAGGPPR